MRVNVDEARSNRLPSCIYHSIRRGSRQIADRDNPVTANADIRSHPRIATAIEHMSTSNHYVVVLGVG
jgi:hypothetical protein